MAQPLSKTKNFKLPDVDFNQLYSILESYDKAEWCRKCIIAVLMRADGMSYKDIKKNFGVDPSSAAKCVDEYLMHGVRGVKQHVERVKKYKIDVELRNKKMREVKRDLFGIETLQANRRHYLLNGTLILTTDKLYYDEIQPTIELLAQERSCDPSEISVVET